MVIRWVLPMRGMTPHYYKLAQIVCKPQFRIDLILQRLSREIRKGWGVDGQQTHTLDPKPYLLRGK